MIPALLLNNILQPIKRTLNRCIINLMFFRTSIKVFEVNLCYQ